MSYRKDAISLRNVPSYKHIRRRVIEPTSSTTPTAPTPTSTSTSSSISSTTTPSLSTELPNSPHTSHPLNHLNFSEKIEDDIDQDEFIDPFASTKTISKSTINSSQNLLDDDYDDNDDIFNDDGDDQTLLLLELQKIKEEENKEKQHQIKEEMRFQQQISLQTHGSLFTNTLLIDKMTSLVKEDEMIKAEFDSTSYAQQDTSNSAPHGIKRKKWTEDSVFSNTAISLGDNEMTKKQRLNNDTTNSDQHQQFLREIFK